MKKTTSDTTERLTVLAYRFWQDCNTFLLAMGRSHETTEELAEFNDISVRSEYRRKAAWRELVGM